MQPTPAETYEQAAALFQQMQQVEEGTVHPRSRSHLLAHGRKTQRAYVMVHGTTNSPLQWLELGEMLHARGHNTLILRMPYHGLLSRKVSELAPLTAQDLRAYGRQAIDLAAGLGEEIALVGISGGAAAASWMAQNRPEVKRSLLLAPFFGIGVAPGFFSTLLMHAWSRLPNYVLEDRREIQRDWVYRGQSTRGVAAYLRLGHEVIERANKGAGMNGQVIVLTTAIDRVASNADTARVVELWRRAGAEVVAVEFPQAMGIPHNCVDPAADPVKKGVVYEKMLELVGERSTEYTDCAAP